MEDDTPRDEPEQASSTEAQDSEGATDHPAGIARRALLKAGWTIPVIAAVQLPAPNTALAADTGIHQDAVTHGDGTFHTDRVL